MTTAASSAPRVLLAKPGLDGHDRGVKVVAMGLRDAGAEVLYLGLRQRVQGILRAAADEDVDVIGLSILSGAHMAILDKLLRERDETGLAVGVPIAVGGTIPPRDAADLEARGVEVFPVGTSVDDVVERLLALGRSRSERVP